MRAAVSSGTATVDEVLAAVRAAPGMAGQALAGQVSRPAAQTFPAEGPERAHVVVLDYGVKGSIVRLLCEAGARVTVMPWDAPAADVLAASPDGILLANGPGDPAALPACVDEVRAMLDAKARVRDLPRPPAARPGARARDVQAALRPPRRQPSGARPRLRPRARDRPEPRLRGARARDRPRLHDGVRARRRHPHVALRRHRRGARAARPRRLVAPVPPRGQPRPARRPRGA